MAAMGSLTTWRKCIVLTSLTWRLKKPHPKGRPKPPVALAMLEDHETLLERDEPLAPATTKRTHQQNGV